MANFRIRSNPSGDYFNWSEPAKPKFYFKGIGFRHFAVFNEDGVPVHHIRGTRAIARGKSEDYVRKLETVTDLLLK